MVFAEKWAFFQLFLFSNMGQENVYYKILEKKKRLSKLWKQEVQKVEKLKMFPKGVRKWFWSKNGHFENFFFFGNIGEENVFYDILEGKSTFLGYKNKKCNNTKN